MNTVFDELELVEKQATSSRTSQRETRINNKNMGCKLCEGLSFLRRCNQVTRPKTPLNSAGIYYISPSPNNHLETSKRKT
jgi:hypothetical protein